MKNLNDYMKFRLGTYSEEENKETKPEGEASTETKPEGEEAKPEGEEKSGEAPKEGELETHSVTGTLFWGFFTALMFKLRKCDPANDSEYKFLGIASLVIALLHAVGTVLQVAYRAKYGDRDDMMDTLESMRSWLSEVKSGKKSIEAGNVDSFIENIEAIGKKLNELIDSGKLSAEDADAIKMNMKITQMEAKKLGIDTGMQSYSKMAVYSKADVIKAQLYLEELGWTKVGEGAYLVPGTEEVVKVTAEGPDDDIAVEKKLASGEISPTAIQQSFEEFKSFVDSLINNKVGSYSDEDEYEDAIEVVQERTEKGYSEDEVAEKAEELEEEKLQTSSEDDVCPECGKDPCECEKKPEDGELQTQSTFADRLIEKLRG